MAGRFGGTVFYTLVYGWTFRRCRILNIATWLDVSAVLYFKHCYMARRFMVIFQDVWAVTY